MNIDSILLARPGHTPSISEVGWGEPPTYYTRCTCGWQGITIETPYAEPLDTIPDYLHEPYRSIALTYGIDSILGDNTAYGHREDAIRQALAHIGYDPEADHKTALRDIADTNTMLHNTIGEPGSALNQIKITGEHLTKAMTALEAAAARLAAWGDGTLPTLPNRHPEALRLLESHRHNQV